MRVLLVVDISNMYYGLRDLSGGQRLRYDRLLEWARRQGELVAAVAFAAYDPGNPEQMAFLNALSAIGFRVRSMPVRQENGRPSGNMDVALALETEKLSGQVDLVILGSGDGDFVPLVESLASQGKVVWVLAPRGVLSMDLARVAHRVILIERLAEEEAGLLEEKATPAPAPEAPLPADSLEALLGRTVRVVRELIREMPEGFLISRIGDRDPVLSQQAGAWGRLPALVAMAALLRQLPGWRIVARGMAWHLTPAPVPGAQELPMRELALEGLSGVPSPEKVRPVLEELARMPQPFAGSRKDLADRLAAAGVPVSRESLRATLGALSGVGALREEEGRVIWPGSAEALARALEEARRRRAWERLSAERAAFRDRLLQALGIPEEERA